MSFLGPIDPPAGLHPADELAQIRDRLRQLKAREGALRKALLRDEAGRVGQHHEVRVRVQRRRVLLRDRLPKHILEQPDYWEERTTSIVRVEKIARPPPAAGPAPFKQPSKEQDEEDFEVIERF